MSLLADIGNFFNQYSLPSSPSNLQSYAAQTANAYGLNPQEFNAQIQTESGYQQFAYNPSSGASGVAQFIPSTANEFGLSNPFDPYASINAAAQYDQQLGGAGAIPLESYGTTASSSGTSNWLSNLYTGFVGTMANNAYPGQWSVYGQPAAQAAQASPTVTGALASTHSAIDSIGSFFSDLTAKSTWERIAVVVIGLILLAFALLMFASKGFEGTVKTVVEK